MCKFAYADDEIDALAMKKTIRTLRVPDELFEMAYLDLKTGEDETKIYDDAEHFTITMTNPAFSYLPSSIFFPSRRVMLRYKRVKYLDLDYRSAGLYFCSISRTVDLYWDNYNDGYSISFNTNGGSAIPIFITGLHNKWFLRRHSETRVCFFRVVCESRLTTPYVFPATMPDLDVMIYANGFRQPIPRFSLSIIYKSSTAPIPWPMWRIAPLRPIVFYSGSKNFIGFTMPAPQSVLIKPDGSSIVRYYYTRAIYTATFHSGVVDTENVITKLKYGASLNAPIMAASGYTFINGMPLCLLTCRRKTRLYRFMEQK
jgi:hypothetical protein